MRRVVVLGAGGSGKSTLARALSARTGIPCVELDTVFWSSELTPMQPSQWAAVQERLCAAETWILDGDLGPYDVLEVRLRHADTVVLLDLPTWLCGWRVLRRSRERLDFWRWLLSWRRRSLPVLLRQIDRHAPEARLIRLGSSRQVAALVRTDLPGG